MDSECAGAGLWLGSPSLSADRRCHAFAPISQQLSFVSHNPIRQLGFTYCRVEGLDVSAQHGGFDHTRWPTNVNLLETELKADDRQEALDDVEAGEALTQPATRFEAIRLDFLVKPLVKVAVFRAGRFTEILCYLQRS